MIIENNLKSTESYYTFEDGQVAWNLSSSHLMLFFLENFVESREKPYGDSTWLNSYSNKVGYSSVVSQNETLRF